MMNTLHSADFPAITVGSPEGVRHAPLGAASRTRKLRR